MGRDRFQASRDKRIAVAKADEAGEVCDSIEVRKNLLARVKNGEMTLEQAQEELKNIKRTGKREGKLTRQQVFSRA